jgi:ABC-type transporter Mla MlaB component
MTEPVQKKDRLSDDITITDSTCDSNPKDITSLVTDWVVVSLESTLTITQLPELQAQLRQYRGQRVQLYGAKVRRIDTAALQLLLAFMSSSEITVGWVEPSFELGSAARLLGLASHLGLPSVEMSF